MDIFNIILSPLQTEKSLKLNELSKYSVVVYSGATKIDIKRAVEKVYSVKVEKVHVIWIMGKTRTVGRGRIIQKRKKVKKAIITLKKGEKIDFIKTKKSK